MRFSSLRLHWQIILPLSLMVVAGLSLLLWGIAGRLTTVDETYHSLIQHDAKGTLLLSRTTRR